MLTIPIAICLGLLSGGHVSHVLVEIVHRFQAGFLPLLTGLAAGSGLAIGITTSHNVGFRGRWWFDIHRLTLDRRSSG